MKSNPVSTPITYRSYAKLNLYLEVLERRTDGHHNIETIFHTVDLGDDLVFAERPSQISLDCSTDEIESGEGNLVHRAAALLKQRLGCPRGVHVELTKRIPVSAGLAGGSGNAAATLVALNHLWGLGLSVDQLQELALELGSDVPYCVVGGAMAAMGRGEELSAIKQAAGGSPVWFVLVHPSPSVPASFVYNHPALHPTGEARVAKGTSALRQAIAHFKAGDFPALVYNRMEEVVFAEYPQLAGFRERLLEAGCMAAAMSGSGPTLFGVCDSKQQALDAAKKFDDVKTSVVRSVGVGVERMA